MEFNDVRFDFIGDYVQKTMKLKADKWAKLQGNEEYRQLIVDFFEKSDQNTLVISLSGAAQLVPSYSYPTSMKNKAVYFVKKEKGLNVGKDNYKTSLSYGDLSASPLDQLSVLVEEVCGNVLDFFGNEERRGDDGVSEPLHKMFIFSFSLLQNW